MINDLDNTIAELLKAKAPPGSLLKDETTTISFELPDADWRLTISGQTVNCYLYDIRENTGLRNWEPWLQSVDDGAQVRRRLPPVGIDCAYCITAWSGAEGDGVAVAYEHQLISEVLLVLLTYRELPRDVLKRSLVNDTIHYRTVVARPDGIKNPPEFWGALNQQLKPSVNYVVTLPMLAEEEPPATSIVEEYKVKVKHLTPGQA